LILHTCLPQSAPTKFDLWGADMPGLSAKRLAVVASLLAILLSQVVQGQLRIQVQPGLGVPQEKATLLFNVTCRVVAEEFRLRDASEVQVPVTLVLGANRDGVVGDETNQVFTVYMSRWDDTLFATSVSRIALQHLLSRDRKARIVRESLRRASLAAPISAAALRPSATSQSQRNDFAPTSPCADVNPDARCFPRIPHSLPKSR
jgi:hypothetical protein